MTAAPFRDQDDAWVRKFAVEMQRNADRLQRQARAAQRSADQARKELKRRKRQGEKHA